jgi:hypothetical protein
MEIDIKFDLVTVIGIALFLFLSAAIIVPTRKGKKE